MTGAELRVRLTALGLTYSFFAKRMKVTTRTVCRWCELDEIASPICPQANQIIDEMNRISRETLHEMRAVMANCNDLTLYTYRTDKDCPGDWPASWHRALTFRLLEHLNMQGQSATVRYKA